jgi:hypothetical protein|tara:strand:+ start:872 stop:1135 length:264 start_codon:yes stop_codon:yes gene_type:complete
MDSIYENYEERIVRMGRNLITMCEKNELYPKDDTMWNAAVTAGNKLVTIGMTYSRFNDTSDLNHNEKKAVAEYLEKYGLDYEAQKML